MQADPGRVDTGITESGDYDIGLDEGEAVVPEESPGGSSEQRQRIDRLSRCRARA